MSDEGQSLDPRAAGAKRLKGRIAIITGAGQGIGPATARRMRKRARSSACAARVAGTAPAAEHPMPRPGLKEEQAAAITLLASDAASFITGQILSGGGAHL